MQRPQRHICEVSERGLRDMSARTAPQGLVTTQARPRESHIALMGIEPAMCINLQQKLANKKSHSISIKPYNTQKEITAKKKRKKEKRKEKKKKDKKERGHRTKTKNETQ